MRATFRKFKLNLRLQENLWPWSMQNLWPWSNFHHNWVQNILSIVAWSRICCRFPEKKKKKHDLITWWIWILQREDYALDSKQFLESGNRINNDWTSTSLNQESGNKSKQWWTIQFPGEKKKNKNSIYCLAQPYEQERFSPGYNINLSLNMNASGQTFTLSAFCTRAYFLTYRPVVNDRTIQAKPNYEN